MRTAGLPKAALVGFALVTCALVTRSGLAQPAAYPPDSAFIPTSCGGQTSFDPVGDSAWKDERDIVGDGTYPALYTHSDGTYVFIRLRIENDPVVTGGGNRPLSQFGWGIGFDTDGVLSGIEYHLVVNGINETVTLVRNSDSAVLLTLQPTMDTATTPFAPRYVQVTAAADGSSFAADGDFFLTVAIPMAEVATATAGDPNPITWTTLRFWAATSSNGTTLSGDFTCWDDAAGAVDLTQAVMDPVTVGAASCANGIKDGTETDVDCGGGCPTRCAIGQGCTANTDCDSAKCDSATSTCVSPCPSVADQTDCDGDGLTNAQEDADRDGVVDAGETSPLLADSDGDGLDDGVEDANRDGVVNAGETSPLLADSDGDGLGDGIEDANRNGRVDDGETSPLLADSDGDGLDDGVEDANKNGRVDAGETSPLLSDTDGDRLGDGAEDENKNGTVDDGETSPLLADTDGGGEPDGSEVLVTGHDPLDPTDDVEVPPADSDGDGIPDSVEDENGNGAVDDGETSPLLADSDGDGLDDGVEDANRNGRVDAGETSPLLADSDGDGLDDGVEDANQNGSLDSGETDPTKADTDGDGLDDGADKGSDPLDPKDPPDAAEDISIFGGGGCAVGGGTAGLHVAWACLLLLLPLARLRRRSAGWSTAPPRRALWPMLGLLVASGISSRAEAQVLRFPAAQFRPALGSRDYWVTDNGMTPGHWAASAGLYLHYAHDPLELVRSSGAETDLVRYRFNVELLIALDLWDRLELGLGLPLTLAQGNGDRSRLGGDPQGGVASAVGDLRLVPKLRLLTRSWFTLAVAAGLSFPTGNQEQYLGEESMTFSPKVVLAMNFKRIGAAVNIGYRARSDQSFALPGAVSQKRVVVDDEFFFSAGLRASLWRDRMDAILDLSLSAAGTEQDREEVPAELLGGLRYFLPAGFVVNFALGPGLTRGLGTPEFRLLAGLGYRYERQEAPRPVVVERDLDRDKDGLLDDKDACPEQPEDPDGFQDDDGCPDPDNDSDGIADAKDSCPNEAEDADKFQDEDGCPDPDNDSDGIADAKDKCPLDPETINGIADEDGCPDRSEGPIKIDAGKIDVPTVHFATSQDRIMKKSFPVLEALAETLKKNPWVKKVRVEGHTDDRGGDAFNLSLSKRRAQSVVDFLVDHGVERDRLLSEGYGETRPIAGNETAEGRAKNRRVDFVIIDPSSSSAR